MPPVNRLWEFSKKGDLCVFDGWEKLQGVKKRPNAKSPSPKELSLLSLWSRGASFGPVRLRFSGDRKRKSRG